MNKNKKGLIIFYENKYWLSEYYDEELQGFFAVPVYITGDEVEVRPAGSNWIYECWNVKIVDEITDNILKSKIYQSWISRLEWNINFCLPNSKALIGCIEKWQSEIEYFNCLISLCV